MTAFNMVLLPLVLASVQAVAQVAVIVVAGHLLARYNYLSASLQKVPIPLT
jgi:hypothetical protein